LSAPIERIFATERRNWFWQIPTAQAQHPVITRALPLNG
jgi:hypothetical protein